MSWSAFPKSMKISTRYKRQLEIKSAQPSQLFSVQSQEYVDQNATATKSQQIKMRKYKAQQRSARVYKRRYNIQEDYDDTYLGIAFVPVEQKMLLPNTWTKPGCPNPIQVNERLTLYQRCLDIVEEIPDF